MQHIDNLSAIYPNKVVQGERTKYWYDCSIATFLMPRCWKFRRDLSLSKRRWQNWRLNRRLSWASHFQRRVSSHCSPCWTFALNLEHQD